MSNSPAALSGPEQACLELAWQAMLAGTIPVGAVVADASGRIIGSGRNAVYGQAEAPLISGSLLAHAEVNALVGLPVDGRHRDCRLVASLEPCQLCTGALRMTGVGALTYLPGERDRVGAAIAPLCRSTAGGNYGPADGQDRAAGGRAGHRLPPEGPPSGRLCHCLPGVAA